VRHESAGSRRRLTSFAASRLPGLRFRLPGLRFRLPLLRLNTSPKVRTSAPQTQAESRFALFPRVRDTPGSSTLPESTQHGDHDGAAAGFDVALEMKDLLPGAQDRAAIGNRYREAWPQHRGLQM